MLLSFSLEEVDEVGARRKGKWDGLNLVLDINKKGKVRKDGNLSTGYSYVTWKQIEHLFPVVLGSVSPSTSSIEHNIPDELLDALANYLSYASVCIGSITAGREQNRVHFFAPLIIMVCSSFNGDVEILADEDIQGNRVRAHSHFDFILKRGDKRVCVVEAKKDDFEQGKARCLVGCDTLSDVENLETVYGIVTNYLEWLFLKLDSVHVTEEMLTVQLESNQPTRPSLRTIANKICALLA